MRETPSIHRSLLGAISGVAAVFAALLLTGCHSIQTSTPPRTALEQLILSTAADRALTNVDLSWLNGRKVYIEEKYFDSYDKPYAIGAIRQKICESGAFLVNDVNAKPATNSPAGTNNPSPPPAGVDYVIEIRSGALAMENSSTMIGIPSLTIPVPLSGALQTPELAFYKSDLSDSYGKFALFAYQRDTGGFVQATGPLDGTAKFHLYKILGISWQRTDIPEFQKHKKPQSAPAQGHS